MVAETFVVEVGEALETFAVVVVVEVLAETIGDEACAVVASGVGLGRSLAAEVVKS